ncbi:MAG: hypothetical protein ACM65K_11120 [Microcoleus sp.]
MNSTASPMTDRDRANLSRPIDYSSIRSVPEIWAISPNRNSVKPSPSTTPTIAVSDQAVKFYG